MDEMKSCLRTEVHWSEVRQMCLAKEEQADMIYAMQTGRIRPGAVYLTGERDK